MSNQIRSIPGLIIFSFISCGMIIWGFYLLIVQAPDKQDEAGQIEEMLGRDPARYEQVPIGSEVAITGQLSNNPTLSGQLYPVARYELVAYSREIWMEDMDSEGNNTSRWTSYRQEIPALQVRFGDYVLQMRGDSEALQVTRFAHTFRDPSGQLRDGSVKIEGFKNGDVVTLVGVKAENGIIQAERLHGGDRASLAAYVRDDASQDRAMAFGLIGMGGIVLIICLMQLIPLLRYF